MQKLLKLEKKTRLDQAAMLFTDLNGDQRVKYAVPEELIRASHISWADGISVDGSRIPGFTKTTCSEWMLIRPDLTRQLLFDWTMGVNGNRTVGFLCDIVDYEYDPRHLAYNAQEVAASYGYVPYSGPKMDIRMDAEGSNMGAYIPSYADKTLEFRNILVRTLLKMDVPIEYHYGENGNVLTIDFVPKPFAIAADNISIAKFVAMELAKSQGINISFKGQSMHMHFSLWKDGKNCFFDPDDKYELSKIGRAFINGILSNISAVHSLTNPMNYGKAYSPKWSTKRDSSAILVPMYYV